MDNQSDGGSEYSKANKTTRSSSNHEAVRTLSAPRNSKEETNDSAAVVAPSDSIGPYDVICGRHALAFNNVGNRRFRVTISMFIGRYSKMVGRKEKTELINEIRDLIFECGGRFLQCRSSAGWTELDNSEAREKVGHALRDTAANAVKSSQSVEASYAKQVFALEQAKLSFATSQQRLSMGRALLNQAQQFPRPVPACGAMNSLMDMVEPISQLNYDRIQRRRLSELLLTMPKNAKVDWSTAVPSFAADYSPDINNRYQYRSSNPLSRRVQEEQEEDEDTKPPAAMKSGSKRKQRKTLPHTSKEANTRYSPTTNEPLPLEIEGSAAGILSNTQRRTTGKRRRYKNTSSYETRNDHAPPAAVPLPFQVDDSTGDEDAHAAIDRELLQRVFLDESRGDGQ